MRMPPWMPDIAITSASAASRMRRSDPAASPRAYASTDSLSRPSTRTVRRRWSRSLIVILPGRRPALQFLRCSRGQPGQLAHRRGLVSRLGRDVAGRDVYVAPELQADAPSALPQPDVVRAQVPDGD